MERRLFIINDKFPVSTASVNGDAKAQNEVYAAVSEALTPDRRSSYKEVFWVSIPDGSAGDRANTNSKKTPGFSFLPIFISPEEHKTQFESYTTSVILPLFDAAVPYPEHNRECYQCFNKVNELIAENLVKYLRPGDAVWIHNHYLLPLAVLLRIRVPQLSIGFSLHGSFPNLERLSWMPKFWLDRLLKGMLGADVLAFKSSECVSHFFQSVQGILGIHADQQVLQYANRLVKAGNFYPADFLKQLDDMKDKQEFFKTEFLDEYSKRDIYEAYRHSGNRMLVLDYGETLGDHDDSATTTAPNIDFLTAVRELSEKDGNEVFLASKRKRSWLEKYFGPLPINLLAEDGAWYKPRNGAWIKDMGLNNTWRTGTQRILERYARRCAGSFVEEKEFSLVWNFDKANAGEARLSAFELIGELEKSPFKKDVDIIIDESYVKIQQANLDKNRIIKEELQKKEYDFVFAACSDKTNENTFMDLRKRENTFTIKIGPEASFARYNLYTPVMVVPLLQAMNHLSCEKVIQ